MAAAVLLAVGEVDHVIDLIREKMSAIVAGGNMGPMISRAAKQRVNGYIERAEAGGATLLLDGRGQVAPDAPEGGYFIGPAIIDRATPDHESACDEIFGPVLTIIRCDTLEEAIEIENANPYGNAAAVYTSSGKVAQRFVDGASAGMIGGEVYRSDDAGITWRKASPDGESIGGRPAYYYGQIDIDPNDPDVVYVNSIRTWGTRDGGESWEYNVFGVGGDDHALWINPDDSNHMILGHDHGMEVSFDGGGGGSSRPSTHFG